MKKAFISLFAGLLILYFAGEAKAAVLFNDDFSSTSLSSEWQVHSTSSGSYSLTDHPGYLRYKLDGESGFAGYWNNWQLGPGSMYTTSLERTFIGSEWTLEIKAHYNLKAGGYYQEPMIHLGFNNGTWTNIYKNADNPSVHYGSASNGTFLYGIGENHLLNAYSQLVNDWRVETIWYKMKRENNSLLSYASFDGLNYELFRELMLPDYVNDQQKIVLDTITGFSSGSYVDYDYIKVTTPAPEPSSMVLGLMGLGSMLGLRRRNRKI